LIKFFGTLDRFDASKPVLPWLRRITRNASVDRFRRKKVRRADSLDTDGFEGEAIEVLSPDLSPEALYARKQLQQRIWSCLARLKPNHREILVLRDYQDLAYSEIAEVLEVPIGTVMSRLHAARKRLRTELLDSGIWSES
jgi:RNA polymerase sigma-70 factor (ECF subfamily)